MSTKDTLFTVGLLLLTIFALAKNKENNKMKDIILANKEELEDPKPKDK